MNREHLPELKIAVIDNGINRELLEFLLPHKKETLACWQIFREGCVPQFLEPEGERESHGTLCTALLLEFLEKNNVTDFQIASVSILNQDRNQELGEFCTALEWCVTQKMDIILMSIGVKIPVYAKRLLPFIEKAKAQKILLLAAASNDFEITYPACYKDVIGIKKGTGYGIKAIRDIKDGIDLEGNFEVSNVIQQYSIFLEETYGVTNSFVLPFVAADICALLRQNGEMNAKDVVNCYPKKKGWDNQTVIPRIESAVLKIAVVYQGKARQKMELVLEDIILGFERNGYSCICVADWEQKICFEKSIFPLSSDKIHEEPGYYGLYFRNNSLVIFFVEKYSADLGFINEMDQVIVLDGNEGENLVDAVIHKIL